MTCRNRPSRDELMELMRSNSNAAIARMVGVTGATVANWIKQERLQGVKRKWSAKSRKERKRMLVEEMENPIVSCHCGCGATFPKYAIYAKKDKHSRQRVERRFLPGHGRHRTHNALRIAKQIGDHTPGMIKAGHILNGIETDFSDEYLGEAWLALAEGENPAERARQIKTENNRSQRMMDIETVLKIPELCEQVCES